MLQVQLAERAESEKGLTDRRKCHKTDEASLRFAIMA